MKTVTNFPDCIITNKYSKTLQSDINKSGSNAPLSGAIILIKNLSKKGA